MYISQSILAKYQSDVNVYVYFWWDDDVGDDNETWIKGETDLAI